MAAIVETRTELVFILEGEPEPKSILIEKAEPLEALLGRLNQVHGRDDLEELCLEDEDEALDLERLLAMLQSGEFRLVHVGAKGKIKVVVTYNNREVEHAFRPSATLRRVIKWAISDKALNLDGEPTDFQLKLGEEILPPDTHVGQLSKRREPVRLSLVFKVKPQG